MSSKVSYVLSAPPASWVSNSGSHPKGTRAAAWRKSAITAIEASSARQQGGGHGCPDPVARSPAEPGPGPGGRPSPGRARGAECGRGANSWDCPIW